MCDKGGNFAISLRKETILQTKKRKEHQILQRYIKKNETNFLTDGGRQITF